MHQMTLLTEVLVRLRYSLEEYGEVVQLIHQKKFSMQHSVGEYWQFVYQLGHNRGSIQ